MFDKTQLEKSEKQSYLLRSAADANDIEHCVQQNGLSPVCRFLCAWKFVWHLDVYSQSIHEKTLTPEIKELYSQRTLNVFLTPEKLRGQQLLDKKWEAHFTSRLLFMCCHHISVKRPVSVRNSLTDNVQLLRLWNKRLGLQQISVIIRHALISFI